MSEEIASQQDQTAQSVNADSESVQQNLSANADSDPANTAIDQDPVSQNTDGDGPDPDDIEPSKAVKELIGKRKQLREVSQEKELLQQKIAYYEKMYNGNQQQPQNVPTQNGNNNQGQPPKMEDFDDIDDFEEARIEYKARKIYEKEFKEHKKVEEQQTIQKTYQQRMAEAKAKNSELADKLTKASWTPDLLNAINQNGAAIEIMMSEKAPEIEAYFADNPQEAYKLASMDNRQAMRTIAKLESKISLEGTTQRKTNKTSQAPPPITPSAGSGSAPIKNFKDMSPKEWSDFQNRKLYGG